MNSQRIISDARREAKRLARISGRPHQHHLDELAALAGAADWSAYLASPTPIPASTPDTDTAEKPRSDAMSVDLCRPTRREWLLLAGMAIASLTLVLPIDHPTVLDSIVILAGVMMLLACLPGTLRALYAGVVHDQIVPVPWRDTIGKMVALATMFGMIGVVNARNLPGFDVISAVEKDRQSSRTMRLLPDMPHVPVAASSRTGDQVKMTVVLMDGRLGPPSLRWKLRFSARAGGSRLQEAYQHNPVVRMTVEADCAGGTYSLTGLEAAASYRSPAAYRHKLGSGQVRRHPLATSTRTTLCGARA